MVCNITEQAAHYQILKSKWGCPLIPGTTLLAEQQTEVLIAKKILWALTAKEILTIGPIKISK
jgi:hypothetical protein